MFEASPKARAHRFVRILGWLALAGLLTGIILGAAGYRSARSEPIVRTTTISVPEWPLSTSPLRIALLSDIHVGGAAMDARRLDRIVDAVNARSPDLVLIAGDFVYGHSPEKGRAATADLTAPLSRLKAPLGVVAVLGNHDHWTDPDAVQEALESAGVTVLKNTAAARGPVVILGIDDAFSGNDQIGLTMKSAEMLAGFRIALTHAPDLAFSLPTDVTLVLGGHSHCGQLVLPLIGPVTERSPLLNKPLYDPRYRCGVVDDDGQTVIVTGGLGASGPPLRIGAPPDWWLITLVPRKPR